VTEYPLSFLNTVPLFLLSKLAREQGVKVLLSGEGADELFGGYVGQMLRKVMMRVASSKGGPVGRAAFGAAIGITEKLGSKIGMIAPAADVGMHTALTGGLRMSGIIGESKQQYARFSDPHDQELAVELMTQLQTYLLPILHRTDRSTMAASVEARVPFLDPDLVGLALAVPPSLKFGSKGVRPVGKQILKRVAESYLPSDIVHRKKMGFVIPPTFYLSRWPESWMRAGFIVSEFNLEPSEFAAWIGAKHGQSACWMLTMEMWGQMFVRDRTPDVVAREFLAVPEA